MISLYNPDDRPNFMANTDLNALSAILTRHGAC